MKVRWQLRSPLLFVTGIRKVRRICAVYYTGYTCCIRQKWQSIVGHMKSLKTMLDHRVFNPLNRYAPSQKTSPYKRETM